MSEINIPMNDWSKSKLAQRKKWLTSRSQRYGARGDAFPVNLDGHGAHYEILGVVKAPLWLIINYLFIGEGAESPEELKQVWKEIHPSFDYEKDKDKEYWVHFFKQIWR